MDSQTIERKKEIMTTRVASYNYWNEFAPFNNE